MLGVISGTTEPILKFLNLILKCLKGTLSMSPIDYFYIFEFHRAVIEEGFIRLFTIMLLPITGKAILKTITKIGKND